MVRRIRGRIPGSLGLMAGTVAPAPWPVIEARCLKFGPLIRDLRCPRRLPRRGGFVSERWYLPNGYCRIRVQRSRGTRYPSLYDGHPDIVEMKAEEAILIPGKATPPTRLRGAPTIDVSRIALNVLLPVVGVVFALILGAVMLVILKANPLSAYAALVNGAVGSRFGLTQTLVKATPLLLVGLGICIAFRANVINIGGEGQIIAGALMATWFPLFFNTWPGLAPHPRHDGRRFRCRLRLGVHPRHPQGPAQRERDPQHDHAERHCAPADEPAPPGTAHGPCRRRRAHLPCAIRPASSPGLAASPRAPHPPARGGHRGGGPGRRGLHLPLADDHRLRHPRRRARTPTPPDTRASTSPPSRRSPSPWPAGLPGWPEWWRSSASSTDSWRGLPAGTDSRGSWRLCWAACIRLASSPPPSCSAVSSSARTPCSARSRCPPPWSTPSWGWSCCSFRGPRCGRGDGRRGGRVSEQMDQEQSA